MSEPSPSFGLNAFYAALSAANASGVMAERYKDDPTHPERVMTYRHMKECEKRMVGWIVAVERIMDREVLLLPGGERAGDSSKVRMVDEDNKPDPKASLCGFGTHSGGTNANG